MMTLLSGGIDTNAISTLIGMYGFPIVACVAMAKWFSGKYEKTNAALTKALNNNTKVMILLASKMGIEIKLDGEE